MRALVLRRSGYHIIHDRRTEESIFLCSGLAGVFLTQTVALLSGAQKVGIFPKVLKDLEWLTRQQEGQVALILGRLGAGGEPGEGGRGWVQWWYQEKK